jgi:hypothetical protein
MARADKESTVAELAERFRSSSGAVLTEYRGLTVSQLGELRKTLDGRRASPRSSPICSKARRLSRSSAVTSSRPPRACATFPGTTRSW